jgi:glycosyltransferase involved in cell wall biosynthesis
VHCGIVIWSLFETKGGLERFGCGLAGALLRRGHTATVFYEDNPKNASAPLYPLPEGVALVPLPLNYKGCRPGLAREQVAASGIDVLAALFSWESMLWMPFLLRGSGIPLLASEHGPPLFIEGRWNAYEHNASLAGADHAHVLLDSYREHYPEFLRERVSVIPNPAPEGDPGAGGARGPRKTLLAAGRFVDDLKRFSLLIRAFVLLSKRFPDWDLEICGDGPDFPACKALAGPLILAGRARLPGTVADMDARYAAADLFCIPSRTEGFPMVVVEAQHHGLAVVGFSGCPGVEGIVRHEESGLLVEDSAPETLADTLARLMEDEGARKRMGERGRDLLSRFAPEMVYGQWEDVLRHTAGYKGNTRMQRVERDEEIVRDAEEKRLLAAFSEIVRRTHPFDRREALRLAASGGIAGMSFTDAETAQFAKKHKRYGITGLRSLFFGVFDSHKTG